MDDYIKRDKLYNNLVLLAKYETGERQQGILGCAETVRMCPAADVAPVVHGLWIPVRESEMTGWRPELAGRDPIGGYVCSACKEEATFDCNDEFVLSNYCPNCGARMDGADND